MTDKLDGIATGDRVRITWEVKVLDLAPNGGLAVEADGGDVSTFIFADAVNSPTFSIERIEAPLAVGDKVVVCGAAPVCGRIVAIDDEHAWVQWPSPGANPIQPLSELQRV